MLRIEHAGEEGPYIVGLTLAVNLEVGRPPIMLVRRGDPLWSPSLGRPPGYTPAAFVLLAELHGRIGHFPSLIRLRPKPGPVTTYEVAELLNLQAIREEARLRR